MNKTKQSVLLVLGGLLLSLSVMAQSVSLNLVNVTVKKAITELKEKSGYSFVYVSNDIDTQRIISVKANDLPSAINQIIEGQDLTYEIQGKNIIISKKLPQTITGTGLTKTVKGYVLDEKGEPLPGATVQVGNTSRGVLTDLDGAYEIQVAPTEQLVFSFVGMQPQLVNVTDQKVINIELSEENNELEEAVAVAFGKQKKESVIGAITSIDVKELKVPSSDLTTALAGNMAGLVAFSRSGEPGQDNTDFFIRGVATFEGNTTPLILIDNIELSATDLARLQPDDIASFSVMKDATATALYGARGANGVILVTTKRGVEGPVKVFARLENAISAPTRTIELADNVTYMKLANEAALTRDPSADLLYTKDKIANTGRPGSNPYIYPNNDWYDMLFNDYATSQRATINLTGGGKVAQYYVSMGLTRDNGILKVDHRNSFNNNIDSKNYTVRANIDINVTKTTKMGVRITGNFDDYSGPINGGSEVYNQVMHANPVMFPAYYEPDPAHTFTQHILFGNYGLATYTNPYAEMVKGYKDRNRSQILAVLDLNQDLEFITKGLSASAMLNISRLSSFSTSRYYKPFYYSLGFYDSFTGKYTLDEINSNGTEYLGYYPGAKSMTNTLYTEMRLNYNRTFGGHGLSGLLVFTTHESLIADSSVTSLAQSLPSRNAGLAGRFTYNWKSRYFAEFNFGYNGSERFAAKHRWGFFPSAGLAWMISNEDFWKPLKKTVNTLKLRYTYGLVGNDNIGTSADRFFYLSSVDMSDSSRSAKFGRDGGSSYDGINVDIYANDNITWETSYKNNFALELGLFDKLNIIAEYYTEKRTNLLQSRSDIPTTMGLTAPVRANIGEAKAHGVDIQSDFQQSWGRDFWTAARLNFTYARGVYSVFEEPDYAEPWRSHIGQSISQKWGYIAERLFVDDAEARNTPSQNFGSAYGGGDIKFTDVNNDGVITAADMVPIGNPTTPEIVYGFGLSLGYKGFDASVFFQGEGNVSFWIDASSTSPFVNETQLMKAYADDHWSEENQNVYALWPRMSVNVNKNNTARSTWFMRDGSFLRLKQVELGYTFPNKRLRKAHIDNLRLYMSGSNLLTWSKFKLWDVELGGDGFNYPIQRVVNLGVNITLK